MNYLLASHTKKTAEEIAADPRTAARTLFGFLGVDEGFDSAILHERCNESGRDRLPWETGQGG
jgi:hypothetical protein